MPTHDIIDNRKEKLVDHINRILSSTESARFAVGYYFLSGLESIAQRLAGVKELRLLIGNTTNKETVEQLAEGYRLVVGCSWRCPQRIPSADSPRPVAPPFPCSLCCR